MQLSWNLSFSSYPWLFFWCIGQVLQNLSDWLFFVCKGELSILNSWNAALESSSFLGSLWSCRLICTECICLQTLAQCPLVPWSLVLRLKGKQVSLSHSQFLMSSPVALWSVEDPESISVWIGVCVGGDVKILIIHGERWLKFQRFDVIEKQGEREVNSQLAFWREGGRDKCKNEREIIFKTSNSICQDLGCRRVAEKLGWKTR